MNIPLFPLSASLALAAVALIGYLVGRGFSAPAANGPTRRELKRARTVIHDLENISRHVQSQLAQHHRSLLQFRKRLRDIDSRDDAANVNQNLAEEAEWMLKPTLTLSTSIARAYEEIRQQTTLLMSFTEVRIDPLTGVGNRRSLHDLLNKMLAMQHRYGAALSVAIFDIDHFKQVNDQHGHLFGDSILREVAEILQQCARESDVVTRFGGEEFVIVMPETDTAGARIFAERARLAIAESTEITVSGGVSYAQAADGKDDLLERADQALYRAKSRGRNRVFVHDGNALIAVDKTETRHARKGLQDHSPLPKSGEAMANRPPQDEAAVEPAGNALRS